MSDFLDEETVAFYIESKEKDSANKDSSDVLENANPLKNHAKYTVDLQQYDFFDNKILGASAELLSLAVSITRMQQPENIYLFRNGLKRAITDLKGKVSILDGPPSVSDKVCFLFCIMLDEQILHSAWGEESSWENQTLVSEIFGMKNGGEQFYIVAERALSQPVLLIDLIELIYVLLKMGFRGQYRVNGNDQLDALLKRLESTIFSQRIITENKDGFGVNLTEDFSRMKFSKPKRPVKYWRQLSLFFVLIAAIYIAIIYWYKETLPQRAQAFYGLEKFSNDYYQSTSNGGEFTYTSTPEEMLSGDFAVPSSELNTVVQEQSKAESSKKWKVQIATYSTSEAATNYITSMKSTISNLQIFEWKALFRVVSEVDSKAMAEETLKKVRASGVDDAFIIPGA